MRKIVEKYGDWFCVVGASGVCISCLVYEGFTAAVPWFCMAMMSLRVIKLEQLLKVATDNKEAGEQPDAA